MSTHFLATPLGNENLAIIADLSNSSDMMALEGLPEDLRKGIDINMHTHCYRVTEQDVIMMKMFAINEYMMFDLPKHCKSTARFITDLLSFADELINKKKSVIQFLFLKSRLLRSRLIILAKIYQLVMLLVKIQFGRFKPKLLT